MHVNGGGNKCTEVTNLQTKTDPQIYRPLSKSVDLAANDGQIGSLLSSLKTAINYEKKGSHALQAHCQTKVHKKKVIATTHCSQHLSSQQRNSNFFKTHIHLVKTHCLRACIFHSVADCTVKVVLLHIS